MPESFSTSRQFTIADLARWQIQEERRYRQQINNQESEAIMPTYGSGSGGNGSNYFTISSSPDGINWSPSRGWYQDTDPVPAPAYSTDPRSYYSDYMSGCTCGACRDAERYANGENFVSGYFSVSGRTGVRPTPQTAPITELNEHFTQSRPLYQPTRKFIKVMTEIIQDLEDAAVVPNPLPEPNVFTIRNTTNTRTVVSVTAESLVGHDFSRQNLSYADFRDQDLRNANFSRAQLDTADFTGANLEGANFNNAYCYGATFTRVLAAGASFRSTTMDYTRIGGADFADADMQGCSMYSPRNFGTASFEGVNLSGINGIYSCDSCDYITQYSDRVMYCSDVAEYRCEDCGYTYCGDCDEYNADGAEHDANCYSRYNRLLHEWDYKPRRYKPKGNYPAEALMGVELEVGGSRNALVKAVNDVDPTESHLYCKKDGSVNGIEVVTHPMTLTWAKTSFDFKSMIKNLVTNGGSTSEGWGLHVHVSRNAFSTYKEDATKKPQPTHQYAWLMFMYRNSDAITQLSRRGATQYSSWSKPSKTQMKEKALRPDSDTRYVAINCNNDKTYEVRCFKTTLDFTEFMGAVEFVDASVNYTRGMTAANILKNQGMTWQSFFEWTATQGARYSNLRSEMIKLTGVTYTS